MAKLKEASYQKYLEEELLQQTKSISEKKKEEFSLLLLRRAIHNELSEVDAEILDMYFFKDYKQKEIAEVCGVSCSSVSRRISKSLDVLYEKLKYAAEYRFGISMEKRCR